MQRRRRRIQRCAADGSDDDAVSGPTGTLTLTIPRKSDAAKRAPRYVSPNAASLRTTVKTVNGQPPTAPRCRRTRPRPRCRPGGRKLHRHAGRRDVHRHDSHADRHGGLSVRSARRQQQRARDQHRDVHDRAGASNPALAAQLDGVVATVTITAPNLQPGTAFSGPVTVSAYDASGALIVGAAPFANPFQLTDTDGTPHTSLTDGSTTGKTVTDGSPNDVVILNYDGANIPSFSITVTINGQTVVARQRASREQSDADADPDADTDGDAGRGHADADADTGRGHADADADTGRRHSHADAYCDADADCHADGDADADADAHADTDADTHPGSRSRSSREPQTRST